MAKSPKGPSKTKPAASKKTALRGKTPVKMPSKKKSVDAGETCIVFGTVAYADAKLAAGLTVIAYDKDESREDMLGQATTDARGAYKISYHAAAFRRSPKERGGADVIVRIYSGQGDLLFASKKKNSAPAEYQLNIQLPVPQYVVRGTVKDASGKPLSNMIVRAFDRDLRFPQLLGTGETAANGDYRIDYRPEAFQLGDAPFRRTPWLIVEVRQTAEGDALARQEVQSADRDQTVSFTLSTAVGISEWQRVGEAVAPLLKGQGAPRLEAGTHGTRADLPPEDLTANDLDFIVIETGLDRAAIEAWSVSIQMVRDAVLRLTEEHAGQQSLLRKQGWPLFYGLVRQQGARDLDALLRDSMLDWQRAWKAARSANQVVALDEQQVEQLMDILRLLQRAQQLDPARMGNREFAQVLAIAPLPLPMTVALDVAAVVQEKGLDDTDALLKLAERYPDAETPIKALVRTVRVHQLTAGHETLARVLNARLEGASDSIAPLARLRAAEWIGLAEEAGISSGLALRTQAQAERQYPLTALESKVHAGLIDLPGLPDSEMAALIKKQPAMVEKLLLGKVPAKAEEAAAHTVLRNTGRFLRTGISMELAAGFIKSGIDSPGAALRYGRESLRKQYRGGLPQEAVAETIDAFLNHADGLVEGGKGATLEIDINRRGPSYYRGKDLGEYQIPLPESVRENAPTLTALFGDVDECLCLPCESMLGQPAYLVDLLNLLAKSTGTSGNALDELRSRRPDIFNLKLGCENAEQTIQHIDIVLEILEKAAALEVRQGVVAEAIQRFVYAKLRQAIYPWCLPFDRGYAEVSAYLAKLGVSREKLLRLRLGAMPMQRAAEALHVPMDQAGNSHVESQWALLTQQRLGARLWAAYGFHIDNDIAIVDPASGERLTNQTVQEVLIRASFLIDRTGLSLGELEQALKTEFVAGFEHGIELSGRGQCKTSAMRLPAEGPVLEGILDRLHRLTRLSATLPGWSIETLGQAIVVCGGIESGATTDQQRADLLDRLTILKRLHDEQGIALDALLERPMSETRLRKAVGLSLTQYNLLKELTGYAPDAQPMDWLAVEEFCQAARRLREIGLTVEQAAQALLTRSRWEAVAGELPASIKSDEQIEELLRSIQQRLRAVVVVRPDVGLETQVAEALGEIYDRATAGKLMTGILDVSGSAGMAPAAAILAELVEALSGGTGHGLGEWLPLMDGQQAAALFSVAAANNPSADERFSSLLTAIAFRRRERALLAVLAEQSGLAETEVASLLGARLLLDPAQGKPLHASEAFLDGSFGADVSAAHPNPPSAAAAAMPRLHAWIDRLYRLRSLSAALAIDHELMQIAEQVVVGASAGIAWRDMLVAAPVAGRSAWRNPQWQALLDLFWLQQPDCLSRPALSELFSRLRASGAQVSPDTVRPLTSRVDIDESLAVPLMAQALSLPSGAIPTVGEVCNPGTLRLIFEWLLAAKHLGANAAQMAQLADVSGNRLAADSAKSLLDTKLAGGGSQSSLQNIGDSLRRQRRDALVAYHTAQIVGRNNSDRWIDANALYEHFLIDHRMEPCFETTRIVEAVTAVQLFVQRILFGLEPGITAQPELKQRWTWMRNYRVWEANRKVFLFPENWLFPELRDDKSSSFKQLESALGQGELNGDLANQAFGQFLDDVAQMGQVQVLGMYEDISRDANGNILKDDAPHPLPLRRTLYVVGRTPNPPYAYFWRHCVDFGSPYMEWSPWQRIELDIQGDHVMPYVMGGSLHIAWPQIKFIKQEVPRPDVWEIKMAWSRFDGSNWKRPNIAREPVSVPDIPFMDERWGFSFRCNTNIDETRAIVRVYTLDVINNTANNDPISQASPPNPLILSPAEDVESILKSVNNSTGSLFDLRQRYSALRADLLLLFEANWMAEGRWRSAPGDVVIDLSGGTASYGDFRNFGWAYKNPSDAITRHQVELTLTSHLKDAVFKNPSDSTVPTGNSFEEGVALFLARLKANSSSYYGTTFIIGMQRSCSRRNISCEAWIKITLPNSTTSDIVKLKGDEGIYECVIDGHNLTPGSNISITKLGTQSSPACTLRLTSQSLSQPLSANSIALDDVPAASQANQMLRFVFNGTHLSQAQLDALGVDLNGPRKLSLYKTISITSNETIIINDVAVRTRIDNPVAHSIPWMNGFQGVPPANGQGQTYALSITDSSNDSIFIFNETGSNDFWIKGAESYLLPMGSSAPTNIWHFSENGISRYIDLDVRQAISNTNLLLYPDTYTEASVRCAKWRAYKLLEVPHFDMQKSTFQAEAAPAISSSFKNFTPVWENEALTGKLAYNNLAPYACYNWEVFFHAPLLVADQLSKQHKFEDAERWLRYVFDPTSADTGADAKRFLKFRVFNELNLNQQVIDDLTLLAQVAGGYGDPDSDDAVKKLIDRWRDAPFRPFLIARRRHIAFLWRTLFAYLDNLIAWADSLYRRDTRESINEATLLYVLAERILGRRPQLHRRGSNRPALTYDQNIAAWDEFANFWIDIGAQWQRPVATAMPIKGTSRQPSPDGMLYFCMPFNDKIASYWNTVDARLSNIRNCRNIEGIQRKLPLMDAPIDPELLVRATAAGLDLGEVIAGLYAPPPHYRYGILSARAAELANECKSLGAAMLSAIEKRDAEHLAQLRSSNEIGLLKLVRDVRTLQITEAERNIDALRANRKSIESRYKQYQRLLGKKDITIPEEQARGGEESMLGSVDSALASNRSSLGLLKEEDEQYMGFMEASGWSTAAGIAKTASGVAHIAAAPAFASIVTEGGAKIATAVAFGLATAGEAFSTVSQGWRSYAEQQGMLAGHIRRRDEWAFQSNQTLKELQQIDKQILANQIRIDIATKELDNHIEQIEQAKAVDEVMRSKFSNVQLYEWMKTELSRLYFNAYRMALEMARNAERAASRELGVKPLNIVRNDYWDSLRDGLLAGERLHQDLKRLEIAYLDQNRREYELVKHISLRRLNPQALANFRVKDSDGQCRCEFDIPEWLFDLDTPGHYLRRIKSVSISIPSVVGPYAGVNCKLTLLKSEVRQEPTATAATPYLRASGDDPRFVDYFGASEAIVTSSGNGDSGLFEPQLRDERFLPFEGSGVISTWRLELPGKYPQFDYATISDVVLSIRYSARDGGDSLRNAATAAIDAQLSPSSSSTASPLRFTMVLSGRADFPTEWARAGATSDLKIPFSRNLLPYWMDAAGLAVREVRVADLSKAAQSPLDFKLVWPPPTGVTDPASWPADALNGEGVGEGNLGLVDGLVDKLILLDVGAKTSPSPSPP
ncbi:MAG: Insecticidal toxin protein (Modular protein) [Nitrospira sp.]|nr:MAG: Insecticidal toxin protein (Modular protein) [Nitrospira sp.]